MTRKSTRRERGFKTAVRRASWYLSGNPKTGTGIEHVLPKGGLRHERVGSVKAISGEVAKASGCSAMDNYGVPPAWRVL